jgi:hypothetical protein
VACYINWKTKEFVTDKGQKSLFLQIFSEVKEPRRGNKGNFRHGLTDILLLVFPAVLCGANDWDGIALFGKEQESWLRKYGDFHHGIPSRDTINRVFSAIDAMGCQKKIASKIM